MSNAYLLYGDLRLDFVFFLCSMFRFVSAYNDSYIIPQFTRRQLYQLNTLSGNLEEIGLVDQASDIITFRVVKESVSRDK